MDELTEGDVNEIINKLVKLELDTKLPSGDYKSVISYNKTLKGIHFLLIQETGGKRGSEQSTRRAIDAFCSMYAPWIDEKQGKGNKNHRKVKEGKATKWLIPARRDSTAELPSNLRKTR